MNKNDANNAERLRVVADSLVTLPYEAWHFGDSVAFEGMLAASAALGTEKYTSFVHGFVRGWAATHGEHVPLDCTAAGAAMCHLYELTGDTAVLDSATALGDYLLSRRRLGKVFTTWEASPLRQPYGDEHLTAEEGDLLAAPPAGFFVDCLHFDPPFFAHLATITGDDSWADEAITQALGYIDGLQDTQTGLFHHFALEGQPNPYVLGWGRGQGWALLGLLDVAETLPEHPSSEKIRDAARRLIIAMLGTQRADGHWDAVVGDATSNLESSTAAFMAYGFRQALELGVITGEHAEQVAASATRAYDAVVKSLDENGRLAEVSAAVWASTQLNHYRHVPRGFTVPWGQGPVALMLAQAL